MQCIVEESEQGISEVFGAEQEKPPGLTYPPLPLPISDHHPLDPPHGGDRHEYKGSLQTR